MSGAGGPEETGPALLPRHLVAPQPVGSARSSAEQDDRDDHGAAPRPVAHELAQGLAGVAAQHLGITGPVVQGLGDRGADDLGGLAQELLSFWSVDPAPGLDD